VKKWSRAADDPRERGSGHGYYSTAKNREPPRPIGVAMPLAGVVFAALAVASKAARRIETAVQRTWSLLLRGSGAPLGSSRATLRRAGTALCQASTTAALRVLVRLEIAHIHFVFLLVCHNSFLNFLLLFSGCVSRAEELPSAGHLLIWNQVIQAD
jgi:hypothetical protein